MGVPHEGWLASIMEYIASFWLWVMRHPQWNYICLCIWLYQGLTKLGMYPMLGEYCPAWGAPPVGVTNIHWNICMHRCIEMGTKGGTLLNISIRTCTPDCLLVRATFCIFAFKNTLEQFWWKFDDINWEKWNEMWFKLLLLSYFSNYTLYIIITITLFIIWL